jgi:phosphohistidine phosphatase
MKTLFILRHAKSNWKDAGVADFQRTLNRRGQRAAMTMGKFIKDKNIKPDLVLSSPAVRAAETMRIVLESAELQVELHFQQELYLASRERLVHIISQLPEDKAQVLLIGHNPGLEELLQGLTGLNEHIPTAALGKIVLDIQSWDEVARASLGQLEWLIRPRELKDY